MPKALRFRVIAGAVSVPSGILMAFEVGGVLGAASFSRGPSPSPIACSKELGKMLADQWIL